MVITIYSHFTHQIMILNDAFRIIKLLHHSYFFFLIQIIIILIYKVEYIYHNHIKFYIKV